ncbi:hypothetical protein FC50_GL000734 [Lacticaseibacillus pantheris DSM 15945 = JCM 12539 = NBRC 106106]|uniref:Uncharacterized protein n=1 Tax=Lacticaseibacillus pantheris DSM 15945 = JCM 12539 = NBRC 106106 TaxID=1423783 RepID=A0A0R1U622_9LACO|nr:hypothetical protein FC50_GL000734 [Lacticaseibacillus pantheris DSM 15945 = JCM 12539 = NBRC 106106]
MGMVMLAAAMVLGGCGQGEATSTTAKNTHTDAAVVRLDQAVDKLFSNDQHNLPADKLTDKQIQAAHTLYNKAVARGSKLTNADVKLVNRADRDISKAKHFFAVTSGLKDALGDSQVIVPDYNADNLVAAWGDVSSYSVFVTKYGDQMKLVNQEVAAVKLVQKLYDGTLGDVTNSNGTESKNYSVKSNVTADAIAAAKKAVNAVKVDAFKTRYMKYVDAAQDAVDAAADSSSAAATSSSADATDASSSSSDDNANATSSSGTTGNSGSSGSGNSGYSSGYNSGYSSSYGTGGGSGSSYTGSGNSGSQGSTSSDGGNTSGSTGGTDSGSTGGSGESDTTGAGASSNSSSDDAQYTGNWSGGI